MSAVASRPELPRTMSTISSQNAPRIVLLGLTDSGKSALLGALARSAETQERTLGGRLSEVSSGLRTLKQTVYENRSMPSSQEITTYPFRLDTFADGRTTTATSTNFALIDPDGRRASELLGGLNGVAPKVASGSLGEHVSNADAVLLVLDASAPDAWIDAGFSECLTFLRKFRRRRGQETDIAGLPVFLVLTKCDLLARAGDTSAIWAERMEARKEEASQRFAEFLNENQDPAFGTIAFTPVATAIRQPALTNSPARDEPFGVADLFRDVTNQARDYYHRRTHSSERLRQVLLIVGTIATFLIGFASVVTLKRTIWKPTPLVAALEAYHADEGSPPIGHLSEPLNSKIETLTGLTRDPEFHRFSQPDQDFVTGRLDELRKYQDFSNRLRTMRLPTAARDLEELSATEKTLKTDLAIPSEYEKAWKTSPAVVRREKMLKEIAPLQAAAKKVMEAYDRQRQKLDGLFVFADRAGNGERLPWPNWTDRVKKELAATEQSPVNADEPIADWPASEGETTPTLAIPLSYLDMNRERERVKTSAQRVATLRDITQVVGLTPASGINLRLGNSFQVDQAPALLNSLRSSYPHCTSWKLANVSDPAINDVKQAARLCYEQMIPPARTAIGQLTVETNNNPLSALAERTASQANFNAWNELTKIALKLAGDETDPLSAFREFAKQTDFTLTMQEATLTLPKDMPGGPFTPNGSLIVYLQNARGITLKRVLKLIEPIEVGKPYRFRADDAKPLTYQPGDSFWAEVAMRDGSAKDWTLGWVGFGAVGRRYQFDRLTRLPRLYRMDQKPETGNFVKDAKLTVMPANGIPKVPDLVPDSIKNR